MDVTPQLSVVIVLTGDTLQPSCDTADLARSLEALARQIEPPAMEVIVPYHRRVQGVDQLRQRFPSVNFLNAEPLTRISKHSGGREHHDELRARGVAATHGDLIACLEDHVYPEPDWAAQILTAHRRPYAAIGGAIENDVDWPLNWAVYYCDLGRYQNPVPTGESAFASTVNIAYKRQALEAIQPIWQQSFNETRVNGALQARGDKLALSPAIIVRHHRSHLRLALAIREFFVWGRSYAWTRSELIDGRHRMQLALLAPLLPPLLLARAGARVLRRGSRAGSFLKALPFAGLLTIGWSLGEMTGYWSAPRQSMQQRDKDNPMERGATANDRSQHHSSANR